MPRLHASKLETLQQGFGKVRDSLEVLAKWADSERLEAWLTRDLKNQLQQTDAGKQFLATWQKVRKIPEEVKSDVELVRGYADFRFTFTGMGSEQTMSSILGVLRSLPLPSGSTNDLDVLRILYHQRWQQRFDDIAEFLNSLEALTEEAKGVIQSEGGPVSDFVAARDSIATLIEVLRSFGDEARQWLTQLVGTDRPMRAATQLAPPEGQKQRPVTGNLDTAFNLTTVRQSREKGDEVRVHYQFYKGNQQLEGKGWTDRFVIRIFGWQDKVLASVVFTQQNGQSDFEPTAAVSWILSNNRWPSSNDTGLNGLQGIRWFSGFGISTMALDYEEEETVELGIAATISLVNDRLLFGYGANLQGQQDKGFWFFAFQLFSTPGFVQSGR